MTRINLKKFEKSLIVRQLQASDWADVVELQKKCFPGMDTWTREQFESQLRIFPDGQFGVEDEGKLDASWGSLMVDFETYKEWHNFDESSDNGNIRNHKEESKTLYGIEMIVAPECPRLKLERRSYKARKKLVR